MSSRTEAIRIQIAQTKAALCADLHEFENKVKSLANVRTQVERHPKSVTLAAFLAALVIGRKVHSKVKRSRPRPPSSI